MECGTRYPRDPHDDQTVRALLRLIRPVIDPELFNRENARLRSAAGLLSLAGDTAVACEILKTLAVSNQSNQAAVSSLLSSLQSQRGLPNASDKAMAGVRRCLEQTRRNFHRPKLVGSEREILESGLGDVYGQGRERMKVAIKRGQDNGFHRWRIVRKSLLRARIS
jgi:CHAD domain